MELKTTEHAAEGTTRVANEHMVQTLRVISAQQVIAPRDFIPVVFGGAGGLHVCDLVGALEIRQAMASVQTGALSALGVIVAPAGRQLSRIIAQPLQDLDAQLDALASEGIIYDNSVTTPSLDLCYQVQVFPLNLPWQSDVDIVAQAFHAEHEQRFGHRLEMPIEPVSMFAYGSGCREHN